MKNLLLALVLLPLAALAQPRHDPEKAIAAQKEAMAPLAYLDGVWRGPAWILMPSGEKRTVTQTERVGPFLGGAVKVMEGRGYGADGQLAFNALGILSYDPARKAHALRSYALGHAGDFAVTLREDGFAWEIPQGPKARVVYTTTVRDGTWHEVGERYVEGREPMRFFEMRLERVGATDWPAGAPVAPK